MKLHLVRNPDREELFDTINQILEFDDWDLLFDELPEQSIVSQLSFEDMISKINPIIKKHAGSNMKHRYVVKRMQIMWTLWMEEAPYEHRFNIRWAYAHQFIGLIGEWENYPNINPGLPLHTVCVLFSLFGENLERFNRLKEKNIKG